MAVATLLVGLLGGADVLAHAPRMVSFGPADSVADSGGVYRVPGVAARNVVFHPDAVPRGLKPPSLGARHGGRKVPPFQNRIPIQTRRVSRDPQVVLTAMTDRPEMGSVPVRVSREAGLPPSAKDDSFTGMVVLVTWRTVRMPAQDADGYAAPVTMQSSQFSYAAVPTRNGWLFVQL
jgi:hypothetical protein